MSVEASTGRTPAERSAARPWQRLLAFEQGGVLVALVLLGIGLALVSPVFLTPGNVLNIGVSVALVGIVAAGQTLVMLSGGLDISVGSIVALAGMVVAIVLTASGNTVVAVIVALAVGAGCGLLNGLVITKLGINPLITTLATLSIYRGLAFIVSDGKAVGAFAPGFTVIGTGRVLGIPIPIVVLAVVFIVGYVLLHATDIGRNIYAIGGNPEAARLSGIDLTRYRLALYVQSGLLAALSGVILTARLASGQPLAASGTELDAIAAVVLGGTALAGGVGTITGTLLGVLVMGTLNNGMILLNVPAFYQYLARGAVLLLAVALDQYRRRGAGRG